MDLRGRYETAANVTPRGLTRTPGGGIPASAWFICILLLALPCAAEAQRAEAQFASAACHVSFSYPQSWEVVPDSSTDATDPCAFLVRPRDWERRAVANDSVDLYTISVQVVAKGIWAQVSETAFRKHGKGWVILGRQDLENPADTISGPGWSGLYGTATEGCDRLSGEYVGLCDQPTALVGTSNRSVMLTGGTQSEDTFRRVLTSLHFPSGPVRPR